MTSLSVLVSVAVLGSSLLARPALPARPALSVQQPLDKEDADGVTPLMRAAARANGADVKALLDKGADPNYRHSTTRVTALMVAAYFGHVDVVKTLLARGARMELKDAVGAAAADWAAQNGHAELEQMLTGPTVSLNPFLNTGTLAFWLMDKAAGKQY